MIFCYTNRLGLIVSSSEELFLPLDRNTCGDPEPDIAWRESVNGMTLSNSSPHSLGSPKQELGDKNIRPWGDEGY